ncbi:MAG: methyltransferase domain-containing protein, partial [Treponema sp.]|nr:methyltransferase domain-containing protein [Treponema sp.]
FGPGMGGGHLTRCMALVSGLRAMDREAWLYLPAVTDAATVAYGLITANDFNKNWLVTEAFLHDKKFGCILLDRFQTPQEELARWAELAPVIGIDEGGAARNAFDFLIDILPGTGKRKPNIADPSLLPLPEKPDRQKENNCGVTLNTPLKILITFGHEDAAGLGPAIAQTLAPEESNEMEITFLRGTLKSHLPDSRSLIPIPQSLNIFESIPNLNKQLGKYDLIITHYGLTAFEALYAGVPVLLVSPSAYHEKLAKKAGFFSLGVGKNAAAKITSVLFADGKLNPAFIESLKKRCAALAARHNLDHPPRQSLAELIGSFTPDAGQNCPACGSKKNPSAIHQTTVSVLARFPERTYIRCKHCGVISMNRLTPPPVEYGREYFFEQYQKQYGLTYIEDFPNLTAMAKRRLALIKSLLPAANGTPLPLLDIGCAYGPFLAAAKEEGFSPQGIDPAQDAVDYVTQTLGIPAAQSFFPPLPQSLVPNAAKPHPQSPFSVVTLWYVIEHLRGCVPALAEIRNLLKPGGMLAFATPSYSGISGRASLKDFLERSPADHWTIWSPAMCRKALKAAGFKVKKIVISGHHPERFPLLGKYARGSKGPLYALLLAASKIFALGDTFEVYAVSVGENSRSG